MNNKLVQELTEKLYEHFNAKTCFEPLSATHQLNEAQAYEIQKSLVLKRAQQLGIGGFKAATTSPASQQKFGVDHPLSGALFKNTMLHSGAVIERHSIPNMLIETEIVYITAQDINEPLQTIADLKKYFTTAMPGIELPGPMFSAGSAPNGVDLVTTAANTDSVLNGTPLPLGDIDPNTIKVTVHKDGIPVSEGLGSDSMGNQWQTLLWLVNQTLAVGYTIKAGHIFYTGALGTVLPGNPGYYQADFGILGQVDFTIK